MPICPTCSSTKIVQNGRIHNGKQRKKPKSSTKEKGKLTIQCPKGYRFAYDELWSFVDTKGNKQWVWLAIDSLVAK